MLSFVLGSQLPDSYLSDYWYVLMLGKASKTEKTKTLKPSSGLFKIAIKIW
mgnify:CR=1 FL=1